MWKWILNIIAILVVAFAVVYRMNYSSNSAVTDAQAMGVKGGDFTVESKSGQVKLSDFRGKTVILYFGFASCPDVCPMSLSYLNGVLKQVPQKENVQVIFVSVDYKRDTPEKVSDYAQFFDKDFIGATGDKTTIEKMTKDYGVYYKFVELKDSNLGYTVDHTSKFFIIDSEGNLQKVISSEERPEVFKEELIEVMK